MPRSTHAQVLHEESDELHRTVDSLELEVRELRAREVVPKAEHDALAAQCTELQETVWELEELRRSQAWCAATQRNAIRLIRILRILSTALPLLMSL